ncbi:MAG: hypothetical protein D6784_12770 [Chloroflexi bacterium]|nr:MAG: hypothetical protein D6784_12770 [Chloroflexota bacterium]
MAVRKGESLYIYGMHDRGGEHLMIHQGKAKGWVLVTEELGANPNDQNGSDYTDLSNQGFGVIVRLNHAYGSNGTIPLPSKYGDFARRVANFVRNSSGAHIWIIGNEPNLEREQPRKHPGASEAEPITPRLYATCYKMCRDAIHRLPGHEHDQVLVAAIGPWNPETHYDADPENQYPANKIPGAPGHYPYFGFWGDYIQYLRDILLAIGPGNCDGIAIHAYTHGVEPDLVFSEQKMGPPFENYHFHFRTYRDQLQAIPPAFRHLPVYLTEMDQDEPWENANRGWVKNAYKEINDWNKAGNQQIRCAVLYRWPKLDKWSIVDKPGVQEDFREAVAMNYQWNPEVVTVPEEKERPMIEVAKLSSTITGAAYRTNFLRHNTPTTVQAGQTLTVTIALQNVGQFTWTAGGNKPFRLGFQWYTLGGEMVKFPPAFDFRTPLPTDVPPGGSVTLQAQLRTPDTPGTYHLRWDMIHEHVTWFTSQGDQGLLITPVTVTSEETAVVPSGPVRVQIQDISASLPRHPSKTYPTRSLSAIRRIVIHHSANKPDIAIQRIATYQVSQRDLPGIAYHFCVDASGQIFQTQPLETVSRHAGQHSDDSIGVCLLGNFTENPPPAAQIEGTARLLASLTTRLNIGLDQVFGASDLFVTGSPGATWPAWKGTLLGRVRQLIAAAGETAPVTPRPTGPAGKPIFHYLLMWHRGPGQWAKWDLLGALEYINKFPVTIGFSIEEAKNARYVTIVGGPAGVPGDAEQILRAAGCQVERLAGATESETRQMLEQLAAQGRRFRTLK